MFDLTKAVAAWSRSVDADRCGISSVGRTKAELIDHLYCEIDHARANGLPDDEAFAAAVARLGSGPEIAAEDAKNRSALATGCALVAGYDRKVLSGGPLGAVVDAEARGLLIGHAIVWASLILAVSLLLSRSATPDALSLVLIVVLMPCWWASDQILRRALRGKSNPGA